jgi:hypothetical protein
LDDGDLEVRHWSQRQRHRRRCVWEEEGGTDNKEEEINVAIS